MTAIDWQRWENDELIPHWCGNCGKKFESYAYYDPYCFDHARDSHIRLDPPRELRLERRSLAAIQKCHEKVDEFSAAFQKHLVCRICGKRDSAELIELTSQIYIHRYVCAKESNESNTCARCGEFFIPATPQSRYCKPECRKAAYFDRRKKKIHIGNEITRERQGAENSS